MGFRPACRHTRGNGISVINKWREESCLLLRPLSPSILSMDPVPRPSATVHSKLLPPTERSAVAKARSLYSVVSSSYKASDKTSVPKCGCRASSMKQVGSRVLPSAGA